MRAHPDVRRHLKPREIEAALDYRNSLGLAGYFVDQVLKACTRAEAPPAPKRGDERLGDAPARTSASARTGRPRWR